MPFIHLVHETFYKRMGIPFPRLNTCIVLFFFSPNILLLEVITNENYFALDISEVLSVNVLKK